MSVRIKTLSRLHLGFMDLNGNLGRRYGSIGVSLSNPSTEITITKNRTLTIKNANHLLAQRISSCIKSFSEHYHTDPNVLIQVHKNIPEHKGLGSGSQLALAISTGLSQIYGIKDTVSEVSRVMGRGKRSSIGIQSFEHGGLIIDSGKRLDHNANPIATPPETLFRFDFPDEWKFVVTIPHQKQGLSGDQEKKAMGKLKPSKDISEKICRLVMMQLLPSFLSRDIEIFGKALTELDRQTGLFFKPVQGGIYCEKTSYKLIDNLLRSGAFGAGQSSWGPAIYGLALSNEAAMVADEMRSYLKKNKIKGTVIVASASNRGAEIKSVKDMNSNKPKKERSSGNFFQQNLFEPETRPQAEINQI
jgi:beta-ribofuranosylaminobenzene 5'-phosphate synthase